MRRLTIAALALACAVPAIAMQTAPRTTTEAGKIMLYQAKNFSGDSYEVDNERRSLRTGWDVYSVAIHPGDRWQLCNRARFQEPCLTLDRSVADLSAIGAAGEVASIRPVPAQPRQ